MGAASVSTAAAGREDASGLTALTELSSLASSRPVGPEVE